MNNYRLVREDEPLDWISTFYIIQKNQVATTHTKPESINYVK
jgi:hypothetical protein